MPFRLPFLTAPGYLAAYSMPPPLKLTSNAAGKKNRKVTGKIVFLALIDPAVETLLIVDNVKFIGGFAVSYTPAPG